MMLVTATWVEVLQRVSEMLGTLMVPVLWSPYECLIV